MAQLTFVPAEIEAYAERHSDPEPELLNELWRITHAKSARPQMLVGPLEGAFLRLLVRIANARRVLEIGTFTGYSALWMAAGLPEDGRLITCDVDPETTAIARSFWARSPHGSKIQLELRPAIETLAKLDGPFDLVFIDADKESYAAYWDAVLPKVPSGGLIVADNVLWSGRILSPSDETDRAIVAFNEKVREDARVERVLLTVRDGMTLCRKK